MMPEIYKHDVDDTLSVMTDVETASEFLTTLNNSHPSFDFTMELKENGRLPFLGGELMKNGCTLNKKVYKKPTDSKLLLRYQRDVDRRYKRSLLNTMLNRGFKLSSTWKFFFTRNVNASKTPLPDCATQAILCSLPSTNSSSQKCLKSHVRNYQKNQKASIRIVLPFKDQKFANAVRKQLDDLYRKINADISPV